MKNLNEWRAGGLYKNVGATRMGRKPEYIPSKLRYPYQKPGKYTVFMCYIIY